LYYAFCRQSKTKHHALVGRPGEERPTRPGHLICIAPAIGTSKAQISLPGCGAVGISPPGQALTGSAGGVAIVFTRKKGSTAASVLALLSLCAVAGCSREEAMSDAAKLARGRELITQMSDKLASAQSLSFTAKEKSEVVGRDGQKRTVDRTRDLLVRRPDRFYAKTTGDRNSETWYNGKYITVAMHREKVFGQSRSPATLDATLDALNNRFGIVLPIADLLYSQPEKFLLSDEMKGGYAGRDKVEGTDCHHLSFMMPRVDWELWLPEQGDSLPRRLRIVDKSHKGEPVSDIVFSNWNLTASTTDEMFKPKVPDEYEGIAIIQRASAISKAEEVQQAEAAKTKSRAAAKE
jgi:hypothetical protein